MEHRWMATAMAEMTHDAAVEWAGHQEGVKPTPLELFSTGIFCAVCDQALDEALKECPGPPHPSLLPHRWRLFTSTMLSSEEADGLRQGLGDPIGSGLPQALNVYCALCGAPFDPTSARCSERGELSQEGPPLADAELERFLHGARGVHLPGATRVWEEIQLIGHDSYLGFADASLDRKHYLRALERFEVSGRLIDGTGAWPPFIACFTEADDPVPVEAQRDTEGTVCSIRLCWTNDVDELDAQDGQWTPVARLPIPSGRCLAWDPRHHLDSGGYELAVVPGTYEVSAFFTHGDCLGLRIDKVILA